MANCDMCGKETDSLFKVLIEGVELNVCENCCGFGKVLTRVRAPAKENVKKVQAVAEKPKEPEIIETVVEDYAEIIKNGRERLGLTQEEFAKKVNERESLIHNVESGRFKPPMGLALKLEKFLHVKLIETFEDTNPNADAQKNKDGALTIGDFIKVKKS